MTLEDIDSSDILFDKKKKYKYILIYGISYKNFVGSKLFHINFDKQMDLLKFMIELDIQYYLLIGSMIKFLTMLNILKEKKMVLHIALIIVLKESELIHIILCL